MKRKLLSFLIAICLILPLGVTLTGCGDHTCTPAEAWSHNDTHHWHACTDENCTEVSDYAEHTFTTSTVNPTLDAAGKTIYTCTVCGKTTETPIAQLTQTNDQKIAILQNAIKVENYAGEVQQTKMHTTNTEDYVSVAPSSSFEKSYTALKSDGTMATYDTSSEVPESIGMERAEYIKKVADDFVKYEIHPDNPTTPTKLVPSSQSVVGNNYANRRVPNELIEDFEYLTTMTNEATLTSTFVDILGMFLPMYQGMAAGYFSDPFTYDVDDIKSNFTIDYANGVYTAKGTITLDTLAYTNDAPISRFTDFNVEFEIVYSNNFVSYYMYNFVYHIDNTPENATDALAEVFIKDEFTYTRTVENDAFAKLEGVLTAHTGEISTVPHYEPLSIYVNGALITSISTEADSAIDTTVNYLINSFLPSENVTITKFMNKDHTVPYDGETIPEDYYGAEVYLVVTPNEGYALVSTVYNVYAQNFNETYTFMTKFTAVAKNVATTINCTNNNPMGEGTVEYDDKIVVDGTETTAVEFTPTKDYITINLYYFTNVSM